MKEAGKIFSVLSDEMKTFATLTIRDLTKSFDKQHFANNHISLEIEAAKITAFLGHNGAGKSTLLNQMIGFTNLIKETFAMEIFLLYRIVNKLAQ